MFQICKYISNGRQKLKIEYGDLEICYLKFGYVFRQICISLSQKHTLDLFRISAIQDDVTFPSCY